MDVSFLTDRLPRRVAAALLLVADVAVLFFLGALAWAGIGLTAVAHRRFSAAMELPMSLAYVAMPIGTGLMFGFLTATIIREWKDGRRMRRRSAMTTILLLILFAAILIRVPLALSLGFSCLFVLLLTENVPLQIMPQRIFAGIDSFSLLAIPFFLLAGNLMTASGITDRVLRFANAVVGRLPGGLAMSNIVANIFFGGISGSAVADTAAIGSILIPAMIKEGYGK